MEMPPDVSEYGFYVGTSGYYFDDWVGIFNPPPVRGKQKRELTEEQRERHDRLCFYQRYFPLVEINNTFYREPMLTQFLDIEQRSNPGTKYVVKMHKDISHTKEWDIDSGKKRMHAHIDAVLPLVETGRFYSFLVQLEDRLYRTQQRLDYLLSVTSEAVNRRIDVHIEFRHNSWHTMHVMQSLRDSGIGVCNTEIPPVKHAFPLKAYATSVKGYIRYSGRNIDHWYPKGPRTTAKERIAARNARYDYFYTEEELQERLKGQFILSTKTGLVAITYNNHYKAKAIVNAVQNMKMLKATLEQQKSFPKVK